MQPWNPHVGEIQKPGEIQVPKGLKAITQYSTNCERRMVVGCDTLFEFDKATLNKDAEETLNALGPLLAKYANHPVTFEGHTDALGSDSYNQSLSEQRACAVKDWLVTHKYVNSMAYTRGLGKKRPIAPNFQKDGSDNPSGRQKNRRVEVVINTCANWQEAEASRRAGQATTSPPAGSNAITSK